MKYLLIACVVLLSCHDTSKEDKRLLRARIEKRITDSLNNVQISNHTNRIKRIKQSLHSIGITGKEADRQIDSMEGLILMADTASIWFKQYRNSLKDSIR